MYSGAFYISLPTTGANFSEIYIVVYLIQDDFFNFLFNADTAILSLLPNIHIFLLKVCVSIFCISCTLSFTFKPFTANQKVLLVFVLLSVFIHQTFSMLPVIFVSVYPRIFFDTLYTRIYSRSSSFSFKYW